MHRPAATAAASRSAVIDRRRSRAVSAIASIADAVAAPATGWLTTTTASATADAPPAAHPLGPRASRLQFHSAAVSIPIAVANVDGYAITADSARRLKNPLYFQGPTPHSNHTNRSA